MLKIDSLTKCTAKFGLQKAAIKNKDFKMTTR